jgi:RNA-directed DNA polymerase
MGVTRQQVGDDQLLLSFEQSASSGHGAGGEGGTEAAACEASQAPTAWDPARALTEHLMEEVCQRDNLNRAYRRVKSNKGAPGVDGMAIRDLGLWIKEHKEELIASLLVGLYQPQPVRRVDIPKPGGGVRQLGIPTVIDRLVQQAILQVLEPLVDPTFSASSYGFRPGRGAHDALAAASKYVADGRTIVVDLDLEKFFDRVNHDILMARLARRIADKRLLRIVRRFLQAGMMHEGVWRRALRRDAAGRSAHPFYNVA